MSIKSSAAPKGVSAVAPAGGISAQLGDKSYPLLLRNAEIERFEMHRDVGIFALLDQVLKNEAKATHCRDLVALGLVGAGMTDSEADLVVSDLPPQSNTALRGVVRELVFAAFAPAEDKKKELEAGSSKKTADPKSMGPDST